MTEPEFLKCSVCYRDYDETECIPKILPNCGHTLCANCIDQILSTQDVPKCPLDRKNFGRKHSSSQDFPLNVALVPLLSERESTKYGICPIHKESTHLWCIVDYEKICLSCFERDPKHKGHSVMPLSSVQYQVQLKKEEINTVLDQIETEQEVILDLIEDKKSEVHGLKKRKFDQIRKFLDKKEEEAWADIELLFAQKRTKTEEVFRKDEELKQKWKIDLGILNNKKMDEKFFSVLNKEIAEKCTVKEENENIVSLSKKIVNEFKATNDSLNKSLVSIFKENHPNIGLHKKKRSKRRSETKELDEVESLLKCKRRGDTLQIQYPKASESENNIVDEYSFVLGNSEGVKTANLDLRRRRFTNEVIPILCCLMEELYDIKNLSINLDHLANGSTEYQEFLSHDFWATDKIEVFSFNKREERKVTVANFFKEIDVSRILLNPLKKMTNLKVLSFSLCGPSIKDAHLVRFVDEAISNFANLESLRLEFVNADVTDISIIYLALKLALTLNRVTDFHLNLTGTRATDDCLKVLMGCTIPKLGPLESLVLRLDHIRMDHNQLKNVDLKQIFVNLKNSVSKIKLFEISMGFTGIVSNKTVKALAKHVLPAMPLLENLSLNFTDINGEIDDKTAQKILKNSCVESIKVFKFHMGGHKLTDDTVIAFARDMLPKMSKLESLDLVFDSQDITSQGLNELWKSLSMMAKSLRTFKFSFKNKSSEEDSIHYFLRSVLIEMTSLSILELDVCDNFSKESFDILFGQLKKIANNIKELGLDFQMDTVITDEQLDIFMSQDLPLMKQLQRFRLNCNYTNITPKSIESLCDKLTKMKDLEYFEIQHAEIEWPKPELEGFQAKNPDLIIDENTVISL